MTIVDDPCVIDHQQRQVNNGQYGWVSDLPPDLQPEQLCFREVGAGGMYGPNAWRVAEMDKLGVYRACVNTRERMPNTDLFGTPYRGGSGSDMLRYHTDCWNEFMTSDSGFQRNRGCNKILAECDYNRWHCVDNLPLTYEGSWWHGADSRQGVQLITRCDY